MHLTIAQRQAAITRNQARIMDLLKWDAATLAALVYGTAVTYLEHMMGDDPEGQTEVLMNSDFWDWWKNQFNIRNEAFVDSWDGLEDAIPVHDLQAIYRDLHNPRVLACELTIPRTALPPYFYKIKAK